jgi:hypothetical protein
MFVSCVLYSKDKRQSQEKAVQIKYRERKKVGIATGYGLDGPGIQSRWGRDF